MEIYGSRFQLIMAIRGDQPYHVVRFASDGSDAGLYLSRFAGRFKTPLAARGSVEELMTLVEELRTK